MLNVPMLDDLNYEALFERARRQIPLYTKQWTDFNDHDPGITTLQTFAWLVDTLNYYINATGEDHRLAYLKLLGIEPQIKAATADLFIKTTLPEINLLRGSKLKAGGIVFEVDKSYHAKSNELIALYCENNGVISDRTQFAGIDGQYTEVFDFDETRESYIYLAFKNKLGSDFKFWLEVKADNGRIPFCDDFTLSTIKWEYFDGKTWVVIDEVDDKTCGFLKTGVISFGGINSQKTMNHPLIMNGYYLRAKLVENNYDLLPAIGKIEVNNIQAVQTNTYSEVVRVPYNGEQLLPIDYYIADDDIVTVGVTRDDGSFEVVCTDNTEEQSCCMLEKSAIAGGYSLIVDTKKCPECLARNKEIVVIVKNKDYYDQMNIGITKGFSNEKISFDAENVLELQIALVDEKDGKEIYQLWSEHDNIKIAGPLEQVFEYNKQTGEIIFGDSINAVQSEAGKRIVVVGLKTSLLENGSVRSRQIETFVDNDLECLSVINYYDAYGAVSPKNSFALEQELEDKISKYPGAAVTESDYLTIVKNTPGLIIDGANVINARNYNSVVGTNYNPSTVLLAVKPLSQKEAHPILSEAYIERILSHIEKYRLLTTVVKVIPARYAGIEVYGKIELSDLNRTNVIEVESKIKQMIDYYDQVEFGKSLIYGKFFSELEVLDCVKKVEQLSLNYEGDCAQKNQQGDIILHPDGLAYTKKIAIEFN